MKLTASMMLTLDGVYQGPVGPDEDRRGGFERGGWALPLFDNEAEAFLAAVYQRADAFLFGRRTYEIFAGYWGAMADSGNPIAGALNTRPKYVASTTLTDPRWANTTVLSGEVAAAVGELRAKPGGELQVHGSARLAQALHAAGLIDEYRLLTFPVTVGAGKALFTDDAPPRGYDLLESRTTRAGAVYQVLAPKAFEAGGLTVQDGREAAR